MRYKDRPLPSCYFCTWICWRRSGGKVSWQWRSLSGVCIPDALESAAVGTIPSTWQLQSTPCAVAAEYARGVCIMRVWQGPLLSCPWTHGLRRLQTAPLGQRVLWPLTFSAGSRRPAQDWHTHSACPPPARRTCRHVRKGSCAAAPVASGTAIATATSCSSALQAWPAPLAIVSCSLEDSTSWDWLDHTPLVLPAAAISQCRDRHGGPRLAAGHSSLCRRRSASPLAATPNETWVYFCSRSSSWTL